jgi:hypothetical protein
MCRPRRCRWWTGYRLLLLLSFCVVVLQSLVGLNFNQEAVEADMRYGLVRVRENAESIAFYGGQANEKMALKEVSSGWERCMHDLSEKAAACRCHQGRTHCQLLYSVLQVWLAGTCVSMCPANVPAPGTHDSAAARHASHCRYGSAHAAQKSKPGIGDCSCALIQPNCHTESLWSWVLVCAAAPIGCRGQLRQAAGGQPELGLLHILLPLPHTAAASSSGGPTLLCRWAHTAVQVQRSAWSAC